ncbi:hypothetical protein [Nitrospira sp. Nam74]
MTRMRRERMQPEWMTKIHTIIAHVLDPALESQGSLLLLYRVGAHTAG